MQIRITKKSGRNQLTCTRDDGSFTTENLGPNLPFHDIAHFVAEQYFKIENGFYGMIEKGHSIQQLSDTAFIKTLEFESWLAEILARGLQTLFSGACLPDQFTWQVTSEIEHMNKNYKVDLDEKKANELLSQYKTLIEKWNLLLDGETLVLEYSLNHEKV